MEQCKLPILIVLPLKEFTLAMAMLGTRPARPLEPLCSLEDIQHDTVSNLLPAPQAL